MTKIKKILSHFLTLNHPFAYMATLMAELTVIAGLFFLVRKYKPRWKNLANFVLVVLLIRIFLLDTYFSWGFYRSQLTVDDVGWRQISVIRYEHLKFFKEPEKIKFFAVGSSQTLALYNAYSEKHEELGVFHLSSMGPLDYYLYRKYIGSKKPDYLLLYVSEFDMAKKPNLEAAKIAPDPGPDWPELLPILFKISREAHSELALKEMIIEAFFPEYKYAFVFRGFIEKWMGKNKALHNQSLLNALAPDEAQLSENIVSVVKDMDKRWLPYNKYFLAKFLSYCRDRSLKIILVEGQYNPRAYTEKSLYLHQAVHRELESLVKEFDNVTFLTREDTHQFTAEEYTDVTHVKPQPAYHFVEGLIKRIEMGIGK